MAGLKDRVTGTLRRQRARRPWLDHLIRAYQKYKDANGDHVAAAITYFSFLAIFPLVLLGASVAGFVLANNADLQQRLEDVISENVPGSLGDTLSQAVQSVIDNRGSIGVIALLGVAYAGLGWVGNLRTGVQLVWASEVDEGELHQGQARGPARARRPRHRDRALAGAHLRRHRGHPRGGHRPAPGRDPRDGHAGRRAGDHARAGRGHGAVHVAVHPAAAAAGALPDGAARGDLRRGRVRGPQDRRHHVPRERDVQPDVRGVRQRGRPADLDQPGLPLPADRGRVDRDRPAAARRGRAHPDRRRRGSPCRSRTKPASGVVGPVPAGTRTREAPRPAAVAGALVGTGALLGAGATATASRLLRRRPVG